MWQTGHGGESGPQESVAEILNSLGRAKDLVRQILTFSRKREQIRQIIPLEDVVKEAAKFLSASLPAEMPAAKSNGYNPGGLELDLLPVDFLRRIR